MLSMLSPARFTARPFAAFAAFAALAAAAGLSVACAGRAAAPATEAVPPPSLADYLSIPRVGSASFSHDERWIAYTSDQGGRQDVWVAPVAGGEARRVSRAEGVVHSFAFSPTRDQLLYESDRGGNDVPRIYLTDSAGSPPRDLLPDLPEDARIGFIAWAPDGDSFLYVTHLPGDSFTTIHRHDLARGVSRPVWTSTPTLSFALASPDLRRIVLLEVRSDVDFNFYLYEDGSGETEPRLLTPHEGEAAYQPTAFSHDGGTLYYTSTEGREFTGLYAMDLATGESRPVALPDWDVESGGPSAGGRYFTRVTNAGGTPEVEVREAASGRTFTLPRPEGAGAGALLPVAFSPSDRYVAARLVTDTRPETLYLVDLAQGGARPLVVVLPPALRHRPMPTGELVHVESFDGLEVPAFVYRPEGPGPHPAVIHVHGGPHAQAKRRFDGLRQYLVARGFVVMVPNVRGSTGYGKTYTSLDNLDLGGAPLRDVVACRDWLVREGGADPERIAVMGASYGGYMALAAAAFTPETFAAHVDFFGPSDMAALVRSYPPYWKVYSSFTFKKWGDPDDPAHAVYQRERSPLFHAERIVGPLLVVQGANDARVPREQSDRLVEALAGRDVPVHYLVLPDEGHGFSRVESRLQAYEAADRFLTRYLLGDASVDVPG